MEGPRARGDLSPEGLPWAIDSRGLPPLGARQDPRGDGNTFYYSTRDRGDAIARFSRFENGSSFRKLAAAAGCRISVIRDGDRSRGDRKPTGRVTRIESGPCEKRERGKPPLPPGGFSLYLDEAAAAHNCRPAACGNARYNILIPGYSRRRADLIARNYPRLTPAPLFASLITTLRKGASRNFFPEGRGKWRR